MNRFLLIAFFGLSAFMGHAQWTLVWSDEFGGNQLDSTKWAPETGGWGWGNNELQYYTDGDNLTVAGGALIIEARQEQFGSNTHTSGKIYTKDIFEIEYGKIEARIKVPLGQGIWPAFWMLGENIDQVSWPQCGEIDIMEHINNEMTIHGTAHWNNGGHVFDGGSSAVNPTSYQIYSIEWNSDEIKWFLNGTQYHSLSIANNTQSTEEFHLPFYLILNLAVGGNWPGYPDATTSFPAHLEIDYVRAYQWDTADLEENEDSVVSIFPNPASSLIIIEASQKGTAIITTVEGSIVSEEELVSGSNTVSIENLASGTYLIVIQHEDGTTSKKKFNKE